MSYTFSRRDFMKYSAVAAVAVAGSSMFTGCGSISNPNRPSATYDAAHDSELSFGGKSGGIFGFGGTADSQTLLTGAKYDIATDFAASCDGQGVECGVNISLYNSNSQTFSESTNLPPQGSGYLQLMLMVPKGWQNLQITYMPTFVADKTITFNMAAADMTRA